MQELLTVAEAARLLKVSVRTIDKWCRANRIPYVWVLTDRRFVQADLEAWLEPQKVATISKAGQ
jgi:excisionase family DNA binding protein